MSTQQSDVELVYLRGRGLGEICRMMLSVCQYDWNMKYLDTRDDFLRLQKAQSKLMFGQVPLLRIDGLNLVQSMAIVRYLARKHDLYGNGPEEFVQCDMIADALRDFNGKFTSIPFSPDPEDAHKAVRDKWMPKYLPYIEHILNTSKSESADTRYLVGDKLTFVDVMLTEVLLYCEERDATFLRDSFPKCWQHLQHMTNLTPLRDYLQSSRRHAPSTIKYAMSVRHILYGHPLPRE